MYDKILHTENRQPSLGIVNRYRLLNNEDNNMFDDMDHLKRGGVVVGPLAPHRRVKKMRQKQRQRQSTNIKINIDNSKKTTRRSNNNPPQRRPPTHTTQIIGGGNHTGLNEQHFSHMLRQLHKLEEKINQPRILQPSQQPNLNKIIDEKSEAVPEIVIAPPIEEVAGVPSEPAVSSSITPIDENHEAGTIRDYDPGDGLTFDLSNEKKNDKKLRHSPFAYRTSVQGSDGGVTHVRRFLYRVKEGGENAGDLIIKMMGQDGKLMELKNLTEKNQEDIYRKIWKYNQEEIKREKKKNAQEREAQKQREAEEQKRLEEDEKKKRAWALEDEENKKKPKRGRPPKKK